MELASRELWLREAKTRHGRVRYTVRSLSARIVYFRRDPNP
jgi:hypothetical protein